MALLAAVQGVQAQPTCSINIGPDLTICQGSDTVLHGPAGFGNYLWSTGETSPSIQVATAGDYWCQVSYPSGNLVTNGDFSGGNAGFSSQFTYSLISVQNEGMYTVGPNASWYHNQFQGTGNGNFLIGNAGYVSWLNGQTDVWCQTIPCCPGQTYTLSYRAQTLTNALPARAVWKMDGVLAQWPDVTFPAYGAGWQQFSTTWTAGPGQTSVTACLSLTSGDGVGDDFGIDDINISGTIFLRDTLHLNVTPLPALDLGPDRVLCEGRDTTLDVSVAGGSYLWQDGSTGPTFLVSAPGTFQVAVTAQNCTATDQVNIAFQPVPTVDLGPDTALCLGKTLNLSASCTGCSYLWQDASAGAAYAVTAPGLYWAEVSNGICTARDSVLVSFNPVPTAALGPDTTLCAGETLVLDATFPGASYTWQDGSHAPSFTATATGSYHVAVQLANCTAQDTIQVSMTPLPAVNIGPDTTVCPGQAVLFDGTTAGATYLWNDGSTGPALTTAQPGTHSVEVTVNGCSASDSAVLANFTLPQVNLGPDTSLCAGASFRAGNAVPGATYLWSTGETTDSIALSAAGTYWLEVRLNGCPARDSIVVGTIPLPAVDLGPDRSICAGTAVTLDATTAGATYAWNTGAATATLNAAGGTWSVLVSVAGCSAADTITLAEQNPPAINLGPDTTLCPGETLTLVAGNPGGATTWSTGATSPTITVGSAGAYSVEVADALGCSSADTVHVAYAAPGALSLGPDFTFCQGSPFTLDASLPGASSYLWSNGSTAPSLQSDVPGSYWVSVAVGNCAVADTVVAAALPAPVLSLGNDTTLCPGETLLLHVPGAGLALQWPGGATGNEFPVGAPGTYWVAATNAAGCRDSAFIHVDYLDPGAMDLGPDTTLCAGELLTLNAGLPGGTTQWSGAATAVAPSITASASGNYIATTVVSGCAVTDSILVTFVPAPQVDLGPDQHLCAGSSLTLTLNVASPLWDDGSTGPSRTIQAGGIYWAQASSGGCTSRDTLVVTAIPLPAVDLGPDTAICAGDVLAVNIPVQGASFAWNDGATAAQRNLPPGSWSVAVTAQGCSAADSITIGSVAPPELHLPADTVLCPGAAWSINVQQPGCTYLWSTGATGPVLPVSGAGTYGVTITRDGCSTAGQVQVAQVDFASFDLGPDTALCPGATLELHASVPGAAVVWQDGSTASHYTVHGPGTYHALVSLHGCLAEDSVAVGITPVPQPDLGPDLMLCAGDTAVLAVAPGAALATWSTGEQGPVLAVSSSGTYAVLLTLDGCTAGDAVNILFRQPVTAIDLGMDRSICPGEVIALNAAIPDASYAWSDGSHQATLLVARPGTYSVEATGPCILARDTVIVQEGSCAPRVHIPNAFTPDHDGINDLFLPVVDGPVLEWSFLVFNRWGERLFSSTAAGEAWDGTYKGSPAPVGTYVWNLHYRASTDQGVVQERRTGTVTLVR